MGLWTIDTTIELEDLERLIDEATSPSLLLKLPSTAPLDRHLQVFSEGKWNIFVAQSEELYRMLAREGGFDIVSHDVLEGKTPLQVGLGTHVCDFSSVTQPNIKKSLVTLDRLFIENANVGISFVGSVESYRKFAGTVIGETAEKLDMQRQIRRGIPDMNTDVIVLEEGSQTASGPFKNLSLPTVLISAENKDSPNKYVLKPSELMDEEMVLGVLRLALADYYKQDVDRPRNVTYVQMTADATLLNWLRELRHDGRRNEVSPLKGYGKFDDVEFIKALLRRNLRKPSDMDELNEAIPAKTDIMMGDISPKYLSFVNFIRDTNRINARYLGVTPYETSMDKLGSLLFALSGSYAFIPLKRKSIDMLRVLLRNVKRKPRLPFRALFDKWDAKIADVCREAEQDILSQEDARIHKGVVALFHAVEKAETGLPAATLAYCLLNSHEELDAFEQTVRRNYEVLNDRITLYDIQRHIVAFNDPLRSRVRNLRRVVFRTQYPPDYDIFRKYRSTEEGEQYVKVFDFLRRINRIYQNAPKKFTVGLSELICAQKIAEDKFLLAEVEAHGKYETLLDHLSKRKEDSSAIREDLSNAVRQAARMSAQGPLLSAKQVENLATFWNDRFGERIHSPINEGMDLFDISIGSREFDSLRTALEAVWNYLANEKLVSGFYSDRWPGNIGVRNGDEYYNLGFRMCYRLPAIIENVTVFQHTNYLPSDSIDQKIQDAEQFIKLFFDEFNDAALAFNSTIVEKSKLNPRDFILEEIVKDINEWKQYELRARTPEKAIEDPVFMSLADKSSLSSILLRPNQETLVQMADAVKSLGGDVAVDTIYERLREYVRASQRTLVEIKQTLSSAHNSFIRSKSGEPLVLYMLAALKNAFSKEKKILSRIKTAFSILPGDVDQKDIAEILYREFDAKPAQYVGLLENFTQNLTPRQSAHEFEGGQAAYEAAVKEKYVPAYFVAMMERGLIAAGAIFNTMIDIKRYTACAHANHPWDRNHIPEYERLLGLAKMSVTNSLQATEACQKIFAGRNDGIVKAADQISSFDKVLYKHIADAYERVRSLEEQSHK